MWQKYFKSGEKHQWKHCNSTLNEQVNQIILRSLTTFTRQQFDAQEVIINSLKKQLEKSQNGKNNFDTKLLSIEENVNTLFNWCPISLSNVRLKNGTCYVFLEGGNSFESATSKCASFTKSINMTTLVSIYLLSVERIEEKDGQTRVRRSVSA